MPKSKKKSAKLLEQNNLKAGRDRLGRFIKGCPTPNPTGRNGLLGIAELIVALDNEALRKKFPNFNAYVARRAFKNTQVLITVMKKVYPDKVEHSGKVTFTQEERDVRLDRLKALGILN